MIQSLFMDNLFKKYLEFKLQDIKWGEIKVNFKNSYEKIFKAKEGDLSSNIFIKDNSLFTDLLFRGELGFAESYINNKWETSNLTNLLKILLKNQQIKKKNWADNYFSKFIEKIKFILKSNSLNQAKKNIHYHYDLGNKFYSLWLDSSMTYSSGIFLKDNDDLLTSQNNKYDNIIKKLDIQSSDTGERYLPSAAIKSLSASEYAATTRAKRAGKKAGKQFVAQPKTIAKKTAGFR